MERRYTVLIIDKLFSVSAENVTHFNFFMSLYLKTQEVEVKTVILSFADIPLQ